MGPHKTGSTYIQKRLHENRETLKSKGVIYPNAYYLFFGHHYLLNALNGADTVEEIRASFSLNIRSDDDAVISSENFIYLNEKGLLKLKKVFEGFDLKLVYYIRRPSLRLLSRWHEEVKQGGVMPADSYFLKHLFKPMQSNEVNILKHVDIAINIFGRDAVKLIDYETAVTDENMLALLFSVLGKSAGITDVRENVNKMVDLSEVEVIRFLNFRASASGLLKGSNVREAFYSFYNEFADVAESLKAGIDNYTYEVVMGDAGFDRAVQKIVTNNYQDMLINETSAVEGEIKSIPSGDWMMDFKLLKEASQISSLVLEKLEGAKR